MQSFIFTKFPHTQDTYRAFFLVTLIKKNIYIYLYIYINEELGIDKSCGIFAIGLCQKNKANLGRALTLFKRPRPVS